MLVSCNFLETDNNVYYQVIFEATDGGHIRGEKNQQVAEGESSSEVIAVADIGYHFTSWSDGCKDEKRLIENVTAHITLYANFKPDVYEFPKMYINTENSSPIVSKEEYINCVVSLDNDNIDEDYSFNNKTGRIKGRGNSTWDFPKKPYKLKFDEKIDLLGNGKAKTWVLSAEYIDPSRVRNYITYSIAEKMEDLLYTTTKEYVELYLNGVYNGLYLILEQNEVGKTRVNIDDSIDNNVSFLIELDGRALEDGSILDLEYFMFKNNPYVIKGPDTDDILYSSETCSNIKDFVEYCFNTILYGTYEEIDAIVDVGSFADAYIIYELTGNVDVDFSSWYLYRDKGSKLGNGPIWDFDISCGNCNYDLDSINTNNLHALGNIWYYSLMQHPEFKELVKSKINNYYDMIIEVIDNSIIDLYKYESYFLRDDNKWHTITREGWPHPQEIVSINTWKDQVEYVKEWMIEKLQFMKEEYNK